MIKKTHFFPIFHFTASHFAVLQLTLSGVADSILIDGHSKVPYLTNAFTKISRTIVALFTFSFLVIGCASAPTTFNAEKNQGQWEAKAQVRDLEKNKSDTVSLEVIAQKDHALRMEVNGTMGVHVASLLMKDTDISYAIHTQKRYISGLVSPRSLKPLLNVNLDPRWLYSIFFDTPLEGWDCKNSEAGLLESCERPDGSKIIWADRNGEKKRITISNPQFEVQVLVKDFTTKVQSPEKAFSLEAPEGYRRYKLQ